MHKPDCAMSLYAHLDPATLKQPLVCDSDCDGSEGEGEPMPWEEDVSERPRSVVPPLRSSTDVVLTGDTARAYKALQTAEAQLKAAQKRKDEALRAFLEAVVR